MDEMPRILEQMRKEHLKEARIKAVYTLTLWAAMAVNTAAAILIILDHWGKHV